MNIRKSNMKKIERVTYESLFYGDDKIACAIAALSNKINELVDAHNELLETETKCACNKMGPCTYHYLHPKGETETVKEEKFKAGHAAPSFKEQESFLGEKEEVKEACQKLHGTNEFCDGYHQTKEYPTTPEKKCCSIDGKDGYHSLLCSRPDLKEEKKLPTSSYEVTCGQCEKSIKHSCGTV